jgi:hypothetical protein
MSFKHEHGFDLTKFDNPDKALALIINQQLMDPGWTEEELLLRKMENKPLVYLEEDGDEFQINDEHEKTFIVLTDQEADQEFEDYFEEDSFRDQWVDAVREGGCDESLKDYMQSCQDNSSRGEILNHYDGVEEEEEVNDTVYYIYRR